jgi:branched-subunit amino acid permease
MTRMDYFTVGSTLLVFIALITVILTSFLAGKNYDAQARRINLWARIAFPAALLLLIGWFVIG